MKPCAVSVQVISSATRLVRLSFLRSFSPKIHLPFSSPHPPSQIPNLLSPPLPSSRRCFHIRSHLSILRSSAVDRFERRITTMGKRLSFQFSHPIASISAISDHASLIWCFDDDFYLFLFRLMDFSCSVVVWKCLDLMFWCCSFVWWILVSWNSCESSLIWCFYDSHVLWSWADPKLFGCILILGIHLKVSWSDVLLLLFCLIDIT